MANQPIDNRDLRIFDLNVNSSLNNIADSISANVSGSGIDINNTLKEINRSLKDIAYILSSLTETYDNR